MNTMKWQLMSSIIHGAISSFSAAITHAQDLNNALNDIRIVTGYGTDTMADFAAEAQRAADILNTTTTEYAKAALIFYQQGLKGDAVTERANTVVKLAEVTGQSAQVVSDQMTAIWNNFDDGTEKLEYYADVLTKLGAATAASTDEISQGLEKFASVADTVGLSYEYAAASVATVVAQTRQSADVVGTAFKTIFARMEGLKLGETLEDGVDLNKYSEALASVGVNILDTSGQLKDMDTILNELGEKWQYFGKETKVALAQTVGGIRQYNQMLALMENWDAVEKNVALAKNATGELAKQQYIWSQSAEAASQRVKNAQNALYESIINDKVIMGAQDIFAQFLGVIENVMESMGGLGPMLLMLMGLFSNKLVPVIMQGATVLRNNWRVATGQAISDTVRMQEVVKIGMMDMLNNSNLSKPMQQQILLSKDLITAKQKLAEASKNMSQMELEEAQRRMQVYEAMVSEAQASLELQDQLTKEIELDKQKLLTGDNKKVLTKHSAADAFKASHTKGMSAEDKANYGEYVDEVADEAALMSSSDVAAAQKRTQESFAQQRMDVQTDPNLTGQARLDKLAELKQAEEQQMQRYRDIIELQKQMGIEGRKSAEELKKVSVGTMDGFQMDGDIAKSGVEYGEDAAKTQGSIDKRVDAGKNVNAAKPRHVETSMIRGQAATGQEMLSQVQGQLDVGDGGGINVSIQNLETLMTKMGEYQAQADQLKTMASELGTSFTGQGANLQAAAQAMGEYKVSADGTLQIMGGYEGSLATVQLRESERESALRALIQAEEEAAKAGKKDEGAAKAVAEAKKRLKAAEEELLKAQAKSKAEFNQLNKSSQTYVKQLSSIRKALTQAASSSKNSAAELKRIDDIFKRLGQGGDVAEQAMKELQQEMIRLGGGSESAANGIEDLANTMKNKLIDSGMSAEEINNFVAHLEKMGLISPEVANKLRQLGDSGEDMGNRIASSGTRAASAVTSLATAASQISMGISGIQALFNAFDEGNTPLQTFLGILMGLSMTLPLVAGGIKLVSALKKASIVIDAASTAAKAANTKVTWKQIEANNAEKVSDMALIIVKIFKNMVEQMGWVGAIAAIAVTALVIGSIIALTAATKAETKAKIENQKAQAESSANTAEAINKTQELADEVDNLTEKYDALAKAGKNTSEVLSEMNDKVPELIASYRDLADTLSSKDEVAINEMTDELEHLYNVAKLTGDYTEFNAKKKEIDDQVTQIEYNNAIRGGQAAGEVAANAMAEATNGSVSGNKMTLDLDGSDATWRVFGWGDSAEDRLGDEDFEESKAQNILKNKMGSYYKGGHSSSWFTKTTAQLEVDYTNPAEFVEYYEALQEAQQEMLNTMTDEQLADSDIYRELNDAISAGAEQYEQMVPLAKAQADAGGKLAEEWLKNGGTTKEGSAIDGMSMENVKTMEEYLAYRQNFIKVAKEQYGLTESQAEMYLREADSLSGVATEYELATAMLKNFNGMTDEQIKTLASDPEAFQEYTDAIKGTLTNAFGELSDEEMKVAVSIAATAENEQDFAEKMQQAMIVSTREGLEASATAAADAMAAAAESGKFKLTDLYDDENFTAYLEEIGMTQVSLTAASYEEQYRIVSQFYSKVSADAYESYQVEQNLLTAKLAARQEEMAAYHEAMKYRKEEVQAEQEAYAKKKEELGSATTEADRLRIQQELDQMEVNFRAKFDFDITSNASELQNEIDQILASIEELQNKKIEMAMDWSGVDKVEAGMKKAAEFAKVLEKDTKKVGNSYVMTAAQARQWLEFYPELGEIAETTTDGMISMDAAKVDAFMENNDMQLDSAIDTQIAELEAQKSALEAELEAKMLELEAAEKLKQGEMDLENVSAQYLVNLRKNLTDYYIGLGYDEQQANVLALQTMEMNEEEYSTRVAELADQQLVDTTEAAEAGANAQVNTLSQLGERWKSFGSFLANNIGTVLADLGAALLDPTRSIGDVFRGYWDNTAIAVTPEGLEDGPEYNYETGNYDLTEADLSAAYKNIGGFQYDSVMADIENLKKGIGSLDGQIDYLKALKEQDLADYGSTDPSGDDSGSDDKDEEELEEVAERYHEITREVEALERATERLGEQADRAYGAKKLQLMKDQSDALKKQYDRQKDLLEMQKAFLAVDLQNIQGNFEIEPVIDGDGNISNYTALLESATAKLNEARIAFNNSAQEEADEEALEAAEKAYEEQIELLEQYEETLDALNDQVDTVTDSFYELQDLKFEELEYALELKIEVNDSDLARIDYYMAKMEGDFYQMAEAAALLTGSTANMGKEGSIGINLNALTAQSDYLTSLQDAYNKNEISQESYIEGLKSGRDAIYENLKALQELDATMMDYYGNTLAAAGEEIAKYSSLIESSAGALGYYLNLATLLGKSTDYKYMGVILKSQADVAQNSYEVAKAKYDMLKTTADERKIAYETAVSNGAGQAELELLEKQWWDAQSAVAEAQDTMLANADTWGNALRAVLDNSLADLGQELENALAEGFGSFDAMNTAFERKNALQEEYLTTTNKIYETNKMMRTAQSEIDKSTNAAAKKRLKQFINETSALQDQTKLSQYELDIQQAKYNLLLAELALEEQQNAKSTVRLQRDNEGNFSYVYTANADKVSEAQQKFEDAQNALYNKGLEGANGYTEKYQQTMQEMYDTLTNLQTQYLEGAFGSEEEYQNAIADAKQYYYEKLENYSRLYSVALSTDSQVAADAWTTEFAAMTQETGKWMNSVNEYLTGTEQAFADFNSALSTIKNDVVGTNLEDMAENTKAIVDYSNQLAQEVTKEGGVIDALTNEISAVEDITEAYATFRDTLKEIETQYEQIAADADAAVKAAAGLPGVTTGQPGDGNTNEQAPGTTPTSTRDVSNLDWARVDAAYNKISNGDWGTGEEILTSGTNAGYTEDEIETAKELAELIAGGETKESAKTILGFDTGGYTGDWAGSYGKLAFLHKKEMVLRPEDTSNFLASMEILERILQILDLQAVSAQLGGMLTSPTLSHQNDGVLEQNVHIEASFPGVQDHNEIELAISNLVNTASQFANRK